LKDTPRLSRTRLDSLHIMGYAWDIGCGKFTIHPGRKGCIRLSGFGRGLSILSMRPVSSRSLNLLEESFSPVMLGTSLAVFTRLDLVCLLCLGLSCASSVFRVFLACKVRLKEDFRLTIFSSLGWKSSLLVGR
jgi:hypothetical protein